MGAIRLATSNSTDEEYGGMIQETRWQVKEFIPSGGSVPANGYFDINVPLTDIEGYTPVGVVQYILNNTKTFIAKFQITGTTTKTLGITVANTTSSSVSISSPHFFVLYLKD